MDWLNLAKVRKQNASCRWLSTKELVFRFTWNRLTQKRQNSIKETSCNYERRSSLYKI